MYIFIALFSLMSWNRGGYGVFYNTITGRREVVGAAKNLPQKFKNHLFAALTIGELYIATDYFPRSTQSDWSI